MNGKFSITHGPLAKTILGQLKDQGLSISKMNAAAAQNDCEAVNRLLVRGMLTDAEGRRARIRINREIARGISQASTPSASGGDGVKGDGDE